MLDFVLCWQERFFYPVASETLRNQSVKFKCMYTDAEWEPYALTLTKKTIQMVWTFFLKWYELQPYFSLNHCMYVIS